MCLREVLLCVHRKRDTFSLSVYLCSHQGSTRTPSLPNFVTHPLCFLTAYKMTSRPSVLAWAPDSKNPDLHFLYFDRTCFKYCSAKNNVKLRENHTELQSTNVSFLTITCCIFWPAEGYCLPHLPVKICLLPFSPFCIKMMQKQQKICINANPSIFLILGLFIYF